MNPASLHDDSIVIDGLVISNWSRSVFEDMRAGGLTAANCTCSTWEGFYDTMMNVARLKRQIEEFDDILMQVHCVDDIHRAKADGKVGIILGWQNMSGIEDQIPFLRVFRDLGVLVMQLTYNTQNLVGSGCWETKDGGLSDFGREVIDEMNRLGILIDLSHVGSQTCRDAIAYSRRPVAYTHVAPSGLLDYSRNKSDEELRFIADHGGGVGVAIYPRFLPWGADTTLENCVEAIEYVINVVGEDCVGIGTDFTQDQSAEWFDRLRHDKGYARLLMPGKGTTAPRPHGLSALKDYPNLTAAMERRGWPESRIRKVVGANWLRLLAEVWTPSTGTSPQSDQSRE